nr:homoserine O-acetyltransferase [Saccharopolyspora sp. HNM0983]
MPPATGAWREADPAGQRRWFTSADHVRLEGGGTLPGYTLAFETWGVLNADRSNAVLVLHALTGDSHAAGPAGPGHPSPGWWDGLIGPGKALDPREHYVVAPNVLGGCQGSTGPASTAPDGNPYGSRFPAVTIRDTVTVEAALTEALGIETWALVLGGSMGGMRALEWAVSRPRQVRRLLVLAAAARAGADQIAWARTQTAAIRQDPGWHGGDYHDFPDGSGPHTGLGIARRIAHTTYRSGTELDVRFGSTAQGDEDPLRGGRFAVESYLDHHADKLVRRFDAASYVVLTEAMNRHDVFRGRSRDALQRVRAETAVAAVSSDRLFPPAQQHELARRITGNPARVIDSPHGHDGFLVETDQVATIVRDLLHRTT